MDRYLVESPHDIGEWHKILGQVLAQGYLTHFDWGCDDDEHCGWAIIEAENRSMALMSVPPLLRGNARAIRLTRMSPKDIKDLKVMHGKK